MDSKNWFEYYGSVFDYVQIDSLFYRIVDLFMAKDRAGSTPDSFKFTIKCPKIITHDKRLDGGENPHDNDDIVSDLQYYIKAQSSLLEKTLCLLLQLFSSMTFNEALKKFEKVELVFDQKFNYAVRGRHKSWSESEEACSFSEIEISAWYGVG
jgi:uncharacterized protein YecE (DUF72 family)